MPRRNARRLTKSVVDSLSLPPAKGPGSLGYAYTWDDEVRGFGVRVFATGARVFVYRTRVAGKAVQVKLGVYPTLTVEEARRLAKKSAGRAADGQSPKLRPDASTSPTIAAAFKTYAAEELVEGKRAERTRVEYRRIWDKYILPALGRKHVDTIDSAAVAKWHSGQGKAKRQADMNRIVLSSFFKWCEARGYRHENSNPCAGVTAFVFKKEKQQSKGKSLTADEYRRLGAALDKALTDGIRPAPKLRKSAKSDATKKHRPKKADLPRKANPVIVAAIRFLALSGWRKLEALSLRWDAIDFARGVVNLADTKTGRSARPLGKVALALLKAQPRKGANPYVFPGENAGTHLTEPKYAWTSIRHEAEVTLRLHDLRHSFTTVACDDLGLHDRFIAGLIGHRLGSVTSRYGEVRENTLRQKADEIADTIDGYMRGREAKVLPINGAKAS